MVKQLSRGFRNNNPFNLKKSHILWQGKITSTDSVFEQFDTRVYGIRAGLILLHTYMTVHNCHTLWTIIGRFAPTCENATTKYVRYISKNMGVNPYDILPVTRATLCNLAYWIIKYENGDTIALCDILHICQTFNIL